MRRPSQLLLLVGICLPGAWAFRPAPRDMCPATCQESGPDPSNWTVVADHVQLRACQKPLILDFSVLVPVTEKQQIRACNVWADDFHPVGVAPKVALDSTEDIAPQLAWTPAASENDVGGRVASQSVEHLRSYLQTNLNRAGKRTILFGASSGTTVGVYVGANLLNPSVAEAFFEPFLGLLWSPGIAASKAALLQACEGRTGDEIFGLIAAASGDFSVVHDAAARWTNGSCVDTSSYEETSQLNSTAVVAVKPRLRATSSVPTIDGTPASTNFTTAAAADCRAIVVQPNDGCGPLVERCGGGLSAQDFYRYNPAPNLCSTLQPGQMVCCTAGTLPKPPEPAPNPDGTCRTETVDNGDDCGKLVTRCGAGLTAAQFYQYNPKSDLCATLQPGQRVCCTRGQLPDIRPKQNPDGSCFAYKIQGGDYCAKIAVAHGLTVQELGDLNKETWGWNGCEDGFWPDNWICLSKGTPPFPAPIANAVCGPQKPATTRPSGSTSRDWARLNPCPLNSCCNVWGQCGTTEDFCIDTNTGAPGTAKKGTYGCISNCGMDIVKSAPPATFIKLGYFEGWNLDRECLNMDASQIDPSFTHVHFAFGAISAGPDFAVSHGDGNKYAEFQFEQFKKLRGPKRVISFGGWTFSAEAPSYHILRDAVKSAESREKVAANLVKFVADHGLDGLDIDWEYPSAPNLGEGVPEGDPSEAPNYLELLKTIRAKLPRDKSLSIAAPASFWYLKQFPIKDIAALLDYIVYMTYDLHGQWDSGNKWATPGCPTGNCLRSHVNLTETINTLAMVTKAGVPSNKLLVGVSSYGRSFQMADPACTGPACLYTGDRLNSNARKGRCTGTAGYISNAEIAEIGGRTWIDKASDSRIMVDADLWVGYMDDSIKESRTKLYRDYNLGGTIEWAVDLAKFHEPPPAFGSGGGGAGSGLNWRQVKSVIKEGEEPGGCTRSLRTGTWADKDCNLNETLFPSLYFPKTRWNAMDCASAWRDLRRIWVGCHQSNRDKDFDFTKGAAQLFSYQGHRCNDLPAKSNCDRKECLPLSDPKADPRARKGACAYEIWNSIATIHEIIYNYNGALDKVGNRIKWKQGDFYSAFAPESSGTTAWTVLLGLLQIPFGMVGARFFGSSFMTSRFFANDQSGEKRGKWIEATTAITGIGLDAAKNALSETKEENKNFSKVYDDIIPEWSRQANQMIALIFDGSDQSLDTLETIISDGKLLDGKADNQPDTPDPPRNMTESWEQEKSIERAFYAVAIPGIWGAKKPNPAVLDFGAGCEINAARYFKEQPGVYNLGWRCVNGRSYIITGVDDEPVKCVGSPRACEIPPRNYFKVVGGLDQLQDGGQEDWGHITVDDLIKGALSTYNKAGGKNDMNPKEMRSNMVETLKVMDEAQLDIQQGGFVRIPVCSAEEAWANLVKGRKAFGDSPNYPCNA